MGELHVINNLWIYLSNSGGLPDGRRATTARWGKRGMDDLGQPVQVEDYGIDNDFLEAPIANLPDAD